MTKLRDLPLPGLRTLLSVAHYESIGKAADMLGVSPGAVSHQMRSLEDRLGYSLLERHGPKIALTPTARHIIPALERGFAGLLDAHAALLAADPQAPFRISVDTSFSSVWLIPRLPELRLLLDGRDVSVVPLDHAIGDRMAVEADLAITYRNFPNGSSLLATRRLMTDRMVALINKDTAANLSAPHAVETVAGLPLIEVDPAMGDALYPRWSDWFAAAGRTMPDRAVQTQVGLSLMAMQAASEGLGVALVPQSVAEGSAATLGLTEIGQDAEDLSLTRHLVWQRETPQIQSIEAVAATLLDSATNTLSAGS